MTSEKEMNAMSPVQPQDLFDRIEQERDELIAFVQELVRIPSPAGQEGPLAQALVAQLQTIGLDTRLDAAGNVIARLPGTEDLPCLMFNSHLDQAPAGE